MIELAILKQYDETSHRANVQLVGSLTTYLDDIPVSVAIPPSAMETGNRVILAIPGGNIKDAVIIATWPEGEPPDGGAMQEHGNEYHYPDFATQLDFLSHKTRHQDGGADELSVAGLSGELADEQKSAWTKISGKPSAYPPEAHKTTHQDGGSDELSLQGLDGEPSALTTHKNDTSAHSATSEATANRIILRDASGRAKVAAPSASDDIARKADVDAKPSTFLQLTDTPSSYSGQGGKVVAVKTDQSGLEFVTPGGGSAPSGTVILLYSDEADSAETTNSTSETTLKSWTLPANSYAKIIIESEARSRVEQDASTKCDFTWRIKVGGSTVKTFIVRIIASSTTGIDSGGRDVLPLKTTVAGGQTGNTTIAITGQMSLSNQYTGILLHSLRVYGTLA